MSIKRRQLLLFLGAAAGTTALKPVGLLPSKAATSGALETSLDSAIALSSTASFQPLKSPMPYDAINISAERQPAEYAQYEIQDDIILPDGYTYDVIAAWGDPIGDSRFGYNNDYLSFVSTGPNEGYLTINFEYISSDTWAETYAAVIGESLPFAEVKQALDSFEDGEVDAFALVEGDPLKDGIVKISKEALLDQGLGVIFVQRSPEGKWSKVPHESERRISGISGLEDGKYLQATGPAIAVFNKTEVEGYTDGLGDQIIGTFGNCSGGTTPWGTVLSAEENIQSQVPEAVYSDGSSFEPSQKAFAADFDGQGNVFGLSCNKYGWIVEVDPSDPTDFGTKHTWIGRYRHEAVGVRAEAGKRLAFYSGCDRRGGHLYKFISTKAVQDPTDKTNSQLLNDGMLYAAIFNPDGTGSWLSLSPDTPVNPVLPSSVVGGMVTLPIRPEGGFGQVEEDAIAQQLAADFATLGDLYEGATLEEKQGAILIDAHFAANAAGATATARPEDTDIAPDGTLFIAFTSGSAGGDGGPDKAIFVGPDGEPDYETGWIMKLIETDNDPAALTFSWEMIATGGEPTDGGIGFANPDNLEFDSQGNLWVVTDMSTSTHNNPVPAGRKDESGEPIVGPGLLGIYGNNSLWKIPLASNAAGAAAEEKAGEAKMFAYGPMECELTGPFFTEDSSTLFIAAQHPGERHGIRKNMATEVRDFEMKTTGGQTFIQQRAVPIGSNWPIGTENAPPKPAVVAIRSLEAGASIV
ncbi:conserved hypothetical protein [Synechococcus sp. PCC 7335]|uniref:PhoX family protein n=1 Tax=Synechococcus sp. (strain ATCC 29403 / PCC 7335) TaxID=91464 RepID=UPI00017EE3A5|nr:alkaline phosphatase PhoX [Synechococcus sp. PCC 7335]EDX87342.1 conserved hypothetical protein [Synechococcus sp. PCC 7335]